MGIATEQATRIYAGFIKTGERANEYFKSWTFDEPLAVSESTDQKFRSVQRLLHKAIRHFVLNYAQFRHLMPVSAEVEGICARAAQKEYNVGTYRADFIIEPDNSIRLIEMNCRFPLNGFFITGFFNMVADAYARETGLSKVDDYTPFFDYLVSYFGAFDDVCILKKGSEKRNETKFIQEVFTEAGFAVHTLACEEIPANLRMLENAAVICELDHTDLLSLPAYALEAIIHSKSLNDLRTVFLVHDKRFFAVLNHDEFLFSALSSDEAAELRAYLVPTYTASERLDLWQNAREQKDGWILKPCVFGKSKNVFAGKVTEQREWERLFSEGETAGMVLQPFISQRLFQGTIGSQRFQDYVVGTLLYFNDQYFGPGIFRASSFPVTNIKDDRKLAPFVTAKSASFTGSI